MRRSLKRLLGVGSVVAGLATVAWAIRDKLLPAPSIPEEPPPRFRTPGEDAPRPATAPEGGDRTPAAGAPTPESTEPAPASDDDLTAITGIGPVYRERLEVAGITSFAALAAAEPDDVARAARVSTDTAAGWIEQAAARP